MFTARVVQRKGDGQPAPYDCLGVASTGGQSKRSSLAVHDCRYLNTVDSLLFTSERRALGYQFMRMRSSD